MVIGIDTSGNVCSVAVLSEEKIVSEFSINNKKTHSAMLIPMLDEMLKKAGLSVEEASLFAVANGPGSFTGLRIGAAGAKGMAFGLCKPIIGVPTLAALSFNVSFFKGLVCPIMDARRKEVYTAAYKYTDDALDTIGSPIIEPVATPINSLIEELNKQELPVMFLGDGVNVYKEEIEQNADFEFSFAPTNLRLQRASSVALLGKLLYQKNPEITRGDFKLTYLRRPQAERERLGL